MDGSVSIDVAASPETVYALVSDITRYGEWSPENLGGVWLDGATGPAVGARFKAKNKRKMSWSTTSTVRIADPGKQFSFGTGRGPDTIWTYTLEPADGGTRVTESYETPREPGAIGRFLTKVGTGVAWADRGADLEAAMRTTLERLKATAEASA